MLRERSQADWDQILTACGVAPLVAAKWAPFFADQLQGDALSLGEEELDDFAGQVLHESALLTATEENLNYSAHALRATWPTRFPDDGTAERFAHHPQEIANYVYGMRLGNVYSGDGWKFRGRGLVQCTGRDAYAHLGCLMGLNLVDEPDLLAEPEYALRSAILWWEGHVPDTCINDLVRVTKRVNGGTIGIAHRGAVTEAARTALA
jgi:putative chitinase